VVYKEKISDYFNSKIVSCNLDFSMNQLYSLGSTAEGKKQNLLDRLFEKEQLQMLEQINSGQE
jgi:hypothetical protein